MEPVLNPVIVARTSIAWAIGIATWGSARTRAPVMTIVRKASPVKTMAVAAAERHAITTKTAPMPRSAMPYRVVVSIAAWQPVVLGIRSVTRPVGSVESLRCALRMPIVSVTESVMAEPVAHHAQITSIVQDRESVVRMGVARKVKSAS